MYFEVKEHQALTCVQNIFTGIDQVHLCLNVAVSLSFYGTMKCINSFVNKWDPWSTFIHPVRNQCSKSNILFLNLGKVVAIDGQVCLYQLLSTTDAESRENKVPMGLFIRVLNLLRNEIRPIFVFDGKVCHFIKKNPLGQWFLIFIWSRKLFICVEINLFGCFSMHL